MDKAKTMHERNMEALCDRERREAEVPSKVAALCREMEQSFAARFVPMNYNPDRLEQFNDWLQYWMRERFPDIEQYPRITARIDPFNRSTLTFPGLPEWLIKAVRHEEQLDMMGAL